MADPVQPDAHEQAQLAVAENLDHMDRHRIRFQKHRGGMTFEEIAREEVSGIKGKQLKELAHEVENSVKVVQAYRTFSNIQEVETLQQETLIDTASEERKMLMAALKATQLVEGPGAVLTREPDWDVRFRAAELLNAKYAVAAKKGGGGLNIAVGVQTNAVSQSKPSTESHVAEVTTYEDVLRGVIAKRERAGRATPDRPPTEEKLLGEGDVIEGA